MNALQRQIRAHNLLKRKDFLHRFCTEVDPKSGKITNDLLYLEVPLRNGEKLIYKFRLRHRRNNPTGRQYPPLKDILISRADGPPLASISKEVEKIVAAEAKAIFVAREQKNES